MLANTFTRFAARPADVGEWEDLLVRYELAPRAFHIAVGKTLPTDSALVERLRRSADLEMMAFRYLRAMADGRPMEHIAAAAASGSDGERSDARWLLARFEQMRARNFAAVQRRGLDVWEWSTRHSEWGECTAYQLLRALVRADAEALAALRTRSRSGEIAC